MIVFRYDKTFEGLLTAVFDAYARKIFPQKLIGESENPPLFAELHDVITQKNRAARVWSGLEKKINHRACNMIMYVWLSEELECDELLFRFIRKIFDSPEDYSLNFADTDVIEAQKLALKVSREGEFVRQFVRWQEGADGTFFAPVAPKYNALPLAIRYFTDRFAAQKWLVYDTKRRYGYYYDLKQATEVTMNDDTHLLGGVLDDDMLARNEKLFQNMWRDYFKAITIRERINPKLQRQHMPRRFWKYLTEKQ